MKSAISVFLKIFLTFIFLNYWGCGFGLFPVSFPGPPIYTKQNKVRDADGIEYSTVILNNVEWLSENLRSSRFRDGRVLFHAMNIAEWDSAQKNGIAAWASYKFSDYNEKIYGKIYNRHAVADSIGLAPEGWSIASESDFKNLMKFTSVEYSIVEGEVNNEIDGESDSEILRSEKVAWRMCYRDFFPGDLGTNESGFSALPGGEYVNGEWTRSSMVSGWWCRNMDQIFEISEHESVILAKLSEGNYGLYVRLVKAKP